MAQHTLTGLIPTLYKAANLVSREIVGFIPAVTVDAAAEGAAVGQELITYKTSRSVIGDVTPGPTLPDVGAKSYGKNPLVITKSRSGWITWNGEQSMAMGGAGGLRANMLADDIQEVMRSLVNEVEADIAALYTSASRAYGTAGTAPFASDLSDPAQVRKILVDNGAPTTDLQLVIDTTGGAKVRSLAQLTKANEAGTTSLREQGILLDIHGFKIRESAQVKSVTKGTGASYLINNASGYAIDATDLAVDTGTGTILAGNVITLAGDTNKYVVGTTLAAGALSLNVPGLRKAVADNAALTVGNNFTANMAFSRSAIRVGIRPPATPPEGDAAMDFTTVTDPISGITFGVWVYGGVKQVMYEIGLAWGVTCDRPEHLALLLG